MRRTVVGIFNNPADAHAAYIELREDGFDQDDIGVVCRYNKARAVSHTAFKEAEPAESCFPPVDLAAGIGTVAVPAFGPVLAAGPVTLILGAGTNRVITGGLAGALEELGVPESEARIYAGRIQEGAVLLSVETHSALIHRVREIFWRHNCTAESLIRRVDTSPGWGETRY